MISICPFLYPGIINRVKAIASGRKGQPVLQLLFDFLKLIRKGEVTGTVTSFLFRAYPAIGLACVLFAGLFIPMPGGRSVLSFEGDFVLFTYVIGLGKFFSVLSAMDTGSSFEAMGGSREAGFSVYAEPAFFFIAGTLALVTGNASFESMVHISGSHPQILQLVIPLILFCLFLLVITESFRVPVDDPNTHLELTMIHEVMILDNSGPALALIHYAASAKTVVLTCVIASLAAAVFQHAVVSIIAYAASIAVIPIAIGILESVMARMRLSHIPQFVLLIASIAFIALLASVFILRGGQNLSRIVIILAGISMLYVFATSRIEGYIRAISFQGAILAILVVLDMGSHGAFELAFLIIETAVFKAIVIPIILINIVRKQEIKREVEPYIPQFFSLLIGSVILVSGFIVAFWASARIETKEPLQFGVSIAIVVMSLVLIVTRKKIVTHILGYIMMENGIFLLSLTVAAQMPFIVNIGVFLDIFVAIYMFVVFLGRIQKAYDNDHIDALRNLKDSP